MRFATLGLTAATAMSFSTSTIAEVDVSASAGVASSYLFRGKDLGNGNGAIFGDITGTVGGAYASVWASSGDANGSEYDLIAGYALDAGPVSLNAGVVNYVYPSISGSDSFGDLSEVFVEVGFEMVTFSYWDNVAGDTDYEYYSLSAELGAFSAVLGYSDVEDDATYDNEDYSLDYTHLDITYAYNDNLSFTVSKIVDFEKDLNANNELSSDDYDALSTANQTAYDSLSFIDDDLLFVVSYSMPIK
ncbi:hypothetical protein A9Q99_14435 [Gammaproteobacteria bacterium 45_16_T64]|nr:hypothetical protein A9Q99_14435 [Gammaproteobacteria bacterium 45_16_T64]